MANRTILVDNNTWNNTHISRVGPAMASDEDHAYEIMRELDVDYVLVIFGGLIGYSSDGEELRFPRKRFSLMNNILEQDGFCRLQIISKYGHWNMCGEPSFLIVMGGQTWDVAYFAEQCHRLLVSCPTV